MKNISLFNQYLIQILDQLYDSFPVPCTIEIDKIVGSVELFHFPPDPVYNYCGPDMSWTGFLTADSDEWQQFPWQKTVVQVEELLGRSLLEPEIDKLITSGMRPLTETEMLARANWEKELHRIAEFRTTQIQSLEERDFKKDILIATLQFMVNERLIRLVDSRPHSAQSTAELSSDLLIARSVSSLKFVLTSQGFAALNIQFKGGKFTKGLSGNQAIKKVLAEKIADGTLQYLVGSLISFGVAGITSF